MNNSSELPQMVNWPWWSSRWFLVRDDTAAMFPTSGEYRKRSINGCWNVQKRIGQIALISRGVNAQFVETAHCRKSEGTNSNF